MNLEILNPLTYPNWDNFLLTHEDHSFFHTSAWARVLSESYGYKPLYFTAIQNGRLSALMPLMEVNSFLTGRRGVSLPFTDYCQAMADNQDAYQKIIRGITDYGKEAGWKYLELRNGKNRFPNMTPSSTYYTHSLDLTPNEQMLLKSFRSSTKRNIKKAENEGVETELYNSFDSVKEFYRLNCLTRKCHGIPPQPFLFFENIFRHIISKNQGSVVLAAFSKKIIAGAVYFHFNSSAIYKYGASDRNYQYLRANNLVMWEAIKRYSQNGCKTLDFGRTEPENLGLLQFKRGWGATEKLIRYYKYDLKRSSFVREHSQLKGWHNMFFTTAPISVSKLIGSLLYKHMG
jgi:lipid II:glycine glycyltransferase (peptidoglycan interpeptide bridge formation enzyme)